MDQLFLQPYLTSQQDKGENLLQVLQSLKLVIFDIDGVLTDGRLFYGKDGEQIKCFNVKDGVALKLLPKWGVEVAVITAKQSLPLQRRMQDLGVQHFYPGCHDKASAFENLVEKIGVLKDQVAYVGDDVIDLQVMPHTGLSICPSDAHILVRRHCDVILSNAGGMGVAREVADLILASRMALEAAYQLATKPQFEKTHNVESQ